jgi:hypothetical protein
MIHKLTRSELDHYRTTSSFPQYLDGLRDLRKRDGGKVLVAEAGVGRQTIKNRLNATALALGIKIKFVRSRSEEVVFEVVDK